MSKVGIADFEWNADPADGVLCLISTRRVLDENNHCCDYNRCPAVVELDACWQGRIDRCLYATNHEGDHHSSRRRHW